MYFKSGLQLIFAIKCKCDWDIYSQFCKEVARKSQAKIDGTPNPNAYFNFDLIKIEFEWDESNEKKKTLNIKANSLKN